MGLHCERLKRGKKEAAALLRSHNQEEKAKEIFVSGIMDNRAILPGWPDGNILVHPYLYSYKYTVYCIIFKKTLFLPGEYTCRWPRTQTGRMCTALVDHRHLLKTSP